ncbi:MAG: PAS domain S-box protein [Acidobacteria bacterium]|nr:PAS domain S-box protein [Acidobacteriota bacterium]
MMQSLFSSLRFRWILLLLLAVIPAVALVIHDHLEYRSAEIAGARENTLRLARLTADRLEQLIEGGQQLLFGVSQMAGIREGDPTACAQVFETLSTRYPRYAGFGAAAPDGAMVVCTIPLVKPVQASEFAWFHRAVQKRDFTFGGYQFSQFVGKPVAVLALPVFGQSGELKTLLFAALDLSGVNQLLPEEELPSGAVLMVFDSEGRFLAAAPSRAQEGEQAAPQVQDIMTLRTHSEGTWEWVGRDGIRRVYSFTPLAGEDEIGGYAGMGIPTQLIYAQGNRAMARNLLWLAAVTILAIVAASGGAELFLMRGIDALVQTTKRLKAGDLRARTKLKSGPAELDLLAQTLDEMAQSLGERIDDLHRAEASARENAERFRILADSVPVQIWLSDTDGQITFFNKPWIDFTGRTLEQDRGTGWAQGVHPEDRDRCLQDYRAAFEFRQKFTTEYRLRRHDGEYHWILGNGVPFYETGSFAGYIGCGVDITERRRAEEALRQHAAQLAALHEIELEISAERDLSQLLEIVTHRAAELLSASHCSTYILEPPEQELRIVASTDSGFLGTYLSKGEGLAGRVALSGRSESVEDYHRWPGRASTYEREEFGPVIAAPLRWQHTTLGVISMSRKSGCLPFAPDDHRLLNQIAAEAAIAIHQAQLFKEVRSGRDRLQVLSRQLIEAQESERRRIANELHDEIGQALTAVAINIQSLRRLTQGDRAHTQRLDESIDIVERSLQQVRTLSLDLRPSMLDDLGLVAALRWYVDRQSRRAGFTAQFAADPLDTRLSPDVETACFRVAQEAITNVVRHARARQVRVELRRRKSRLQLYISDDGRGFDVRTARERAARGISLGLLGMQERVELASGELRIESSAACGTEVHVSFPLG